LSDLFDKGDTAAFLEVALGKLPGSLVVVKGDVKVGSGPEDQVAGGSGFHGSVETLDERDVVGFGIEFHELNDGVRTLLVTTLSEVEAALASAFGCGRDTVNAKVESHGGFLWLIY
jgi:hypothetical protein